MGMDSRCTHGSNDSVAVVAFDRTKNKALMGSSTCADGRLFVGRGFRQPVELAHLSEGDVSSCVQRMY